MIAAMRGRYGVIDDPRRCAGGRWPPRPKTVDDALVEIERAVEKWLRLCEALQARDDKDNTGKVSVRDLPPAVQSAMNKSATDLRALYAKVKRKINANV